MNDQIGKQSLVMTYCPLCGSGMAFQTQDQFGVSGLLYQSDVLLYDRNPYFGYESRADTYFPINHHDDRLPSKSWGVGLSIGNHHKAWSLEYLKKRGSHEIQWHGFQLNIEVEESGIRISDRDTGKQRPVTRLYWFAWATFHPDTELEK